MKGNRKLRLAAFLTYLGHFLAGLVLFLTLFLSAVTAEPEGWEGIGVAILLVLSIFVAIYAVILALPLLFSFLAYRKEKRGFTVACIPFDGLYILFNLTYMLGVITNGDATFLIFFAALLFPIATLTLNVLAIKNKMPRKSEPYKGEQK